MSGKGGALHYVDGETGFEWRDDGKYKNMVDVGALWYARISLILFIITVLVIVIMLLKVDGDVQALKASIVAKRAAFWAPKPAAAQA
jgi:hypothetical protein